MLGGARRIRHGAWGSSYVRWKGRPTGRKIATPNSAGRGSAYDYRPSPRQLRRSSPKRMMGSSVSEDRGDRSVRISMRDRPDVKG
ncbi:hypothetical protein T261_05747 [Streptomyces lydicus]|nr:hypothetical protein T261_05747 [Streptomyces lydicus]